MPKRRNSRVQRAAKTAMAAIKNLAGSLEDLGEEIRNAAAAASRNHRGSQGGIRRRRKLTAHARSFLKLQGRYLGLVRHLPAKHRVRVKALKAAKGYPAAIREALRLR